MNQRDQRVDILRGLAIFTMIAANMAAHSLAEPHGTFMRLYGSLAAPMFIFLAGLMVAYTVKHKAHPISYYLKRGAMIILVAALMDVFLWGTVPFTTFDVLYVIGISMPFLYFFLKLSGGFQIALTVFVLAVTPGLQYHFGYQAYPTEVSLFPWPGVSAIQEIPVGHQWLLDGWFPLFPWIAVSMLGAFVGSWQEKWTSARFDRILAGVGSTLFSLGALTWWYFQPTLHSNDGFIESPHPTNFYRILLTREGYSELFYPPTLFYLFTFLGAILLLLVLMRRLQSIKILQLLSVFGRSSLLVYILHTTFIVLIFNRLDSYDAGTFIGLYFLHTAVLWGICYATQTFTKGKKLPFAVRFLLGG